MYSILSVLSVMAMCMTYQAASGIYPMMVLFIFFMNWNRGEPIRKGIHFVAVSAFAYTTAMIIFYVFVMNFTEGYVSGNILPIEHLIDGCYHNFYQYYANVYHDFKLVWIFLVIVIVIGFLLGVIRDTVCYKWQAIFGASIVVGISGILVFGAYPLLENPIFAPRAMYGIGILLTLFMVNSIKTSYMSKVAGTLLSWGFFVFALTYGNTLAEQARYTDFRVEMVINDLIDLEVMNTDTEKKVQLKGDIGKSPIITNMLEYYPVLNRLVPSTFASLGGWTEVYFFEYFGLKNVQQNKDWESEYVDIVEMELPILCDMIYHTIKGNSAYILIELK